MNTGECTNPQRRRIDACQKEHKVLWVSEPWLFLRLIFLLHPSNKGGCVWCGNIANVVEHDDWDAYKDKELYLSFFKCGAVPMCSPCNGAKRQGLVLCPRCRKQGHYCPAGDVCWSCKPAEERERLIYQKEQRKRNKNTYSKKAYRKYHPEKRVNIITGKWEVVTNGKSRS